MVEHEVESVAFERKTDYRGYSVKAFYLKDSQDALVEITKGGKSHRSFLFPAYKIWNIAAHFEDIVDGEEAGHDGGYRMASWNGITPTGQPQPLPQPSEASQ
jgi:hypothetical protein